MSEEPESIPLDQLPMTTLEQQQAARIAELERELESHAFELSPSMVQARNDQLNEEKETLKAERDTLSERVKELEAKLTTITEDVDYVGGLPFWQHKHHQIMMLNADLVISEAKLKYAANEMAEALEWLIDNSRAVRVVNHRYIQDGISKLDSALAKYVAL